MTAMQAPWIITLAELAARPGSSLPVERTVTLSEDWGTDVIAIPAGSQLELTGTIDRVLDGVYAHLQVTGTARGECVRCLATVHQDLDVPIAEMFFNARAIAHMRAEGAEDTDELNVITDEQIDVEQVVRDALVSSFPFQVLCEEDCPGLCAHCGVELRDAPADHHHDVIDPRWAKLAELATLQKATDE